MTLQSLAAFCTIALSQLSGKSWLLVEGEVVSRNAINKYHSTATIKITKVYVGNTESIGLTFVDKYSMFGSGGFSASTDFTVGEKGFWTITIDKSTIETVQDLSMSFSIRSREKVLLENKRYIQIKHLAEELSIFQRQKVADKHNYILKCVESSTPEVSQWFINHYFNTSKDDAARYFSTLDLSKLRDITIAGQIVIDSYLSVLLGDEWTLSSKRKLLHQKWTSVRHDDYIINRILNHFDLIDQRHQIQSNSLFTCCVDLYNSNFYTETINCSILSLIMNCGLRSVDSEKQFNFLVNVVKGKGTITIRRYAASSLELLCKDNKNRVEVINNIDRQGLDESILNYLDKAVKNLEK